MKEMKFNIGDNPELSAKVQEKLFDMGFSWIRAKQTVSHSRAPYLYAYDDHEITFSGTPARFTAHKNEEVCPYEFLGLEKPSETIPEETEATSNPPVDSAVESLWEAHKSFKF